MPRFEITSPDGKKYEVNAPEGATEQDAIAYVQQNMAKPQEPVAEPKVVGSDVYKSSTDIPRQLGLTARYGAEGLADTVGIFSNPLASMSNRFLGTNMKDARSATSNLLDQIGLPQPQTAQERVVGDASRMMAGTGAFMGAAKTASKSLPEVSSKVMQQIATNPLMQISSAAGSGYAGGVARENGAGFGGQLASSIVGGVGVPMLVNTGANLGRGIAKSITKLLNPKSIELSVDNSLKQAGIDLSKLPSNVQKSIREDVKKALNTNSSLSPDAIRRLADYKSLGATPMRSNLTLNPADVTRDKNLAKLGANSTDTTAQQLANNMNSNNKVLINKMNELGANTADDAYSAGNKVISALDQRNTSAKNIINQFYDKARNTQGRSAQLDPRTFTNQANDALDNALLGGKLPSDVRNLLNKAAKGEMPLTVDTAEQFKTRIGELQRATNDIAEKKALGLVREALDNTPLLDGQGKEAINAFNNARRVNASYMKIVEKTPALKAVRDGIEPDKFVNQFIIGNGAKSNVMNVAMLKNNIKSNPEAMQAVRGQILANLKAKALNGMADEVANFSPNAYTKQLENIGDRKLALFFNKDEIDQLKTIGRVSTYENFQPKGSAVNNSNSASALFSHTIDAIGRYVPFGSTILGEPVKNIKLSLGAKNTLNSAKALPMEQIKQQMGIPVFPLLAGSGLLSTE